MRFLGSYANGFAPRDYQPQFPELWRGCIGAWCPVLGPTGLTLRDWSGYQNHGTLTNFTTSAAWTTLEGHHAIDPDGTNDFVSVPNNTIHNPGARMTAAAWVYLDATPASNGGVVSKSAATSNGWLLYVTQNGGALMTNFGIHSGSFTGTSAGVTFPVQTLTHICGTYDGATLRVYINGQQTGNGTAKTGAITASTTALSIGNLYASSQPINGKVLDVMLWDRALSPREINLHALHPALAYIPDLDRREFLIEQFGNRRRRVLCGSAA